jgi:O-antigen/teichoic acid export membrane protein
LSNQPSLRQRGLRAGGWVVGGQALTQVMRFVSNLLLTRFLLPEAFGLMAVISTLLMMLNLISDIGSGTVIVQSPRGNERQFLNTAWTLQVLRGVGLWFAAMLIALGLLFAQQQGWLGQGTVYADPRLPLLITVASFVSVLIGLGSINAKLAERNLDFAAISLIDLAVGAAAIVGMAIGAYYTGSIWVLIAGSLLSAAAKCVLGHVFLTGPRAQFVLEPAAIRELIGKGKWVVVSSILGLVAVSGDKLLLGGLVDPATLGLYSIALGLATIASSTITSLLGRVVFPVFSEVVRSRPQDLQRTYQRLQQMVDGGVGFLGGFVFVASGFIVGLLYDARYVGVAHILSYLAVGSLGVRFIVVEQVYIALGKMSLLAMAILPRAIIVLVGVPAGFAAFGLDGALAAVVLSQFAHWPLAIWFRTKYDLNSWSNDLFLPISIAAGAGAGWLIVRWAPSIAA